MQFFGVMPLIEIHRHNGGFSVSGHAGYAEHGKDIVCAAVSALVQTFVAAVKGLTADNIKCDISAGNAVIQYGNLSRDAQLLLDSFFVGVEMISAEYPQHVQIAQACKA